MGIVIEIKYAEADALERESQKALEQIEDKNYAEQMKQDGVKMILKYGIAGIYAMHKNKERYYGDQESFTP